MKVRVFPGGQQVLCSFLLVEAVAETGFCSVCPREFLGFIELSTIIDISLSCKIVFVVDVSIVCDN